MATNSTSERQLRKAKGTEKAMSSTRHRTTVAKVIAIGLLLATLLAVLLSSATAGAAVTSTKAFSWGYNEFGQLGNGTHGAGTETNTPGAVSNLTSVKSVKAGCNHGLALKTNGTVWTWGYNYYGQLGNDTHGDGTESDVPVKAKIDNVKAISAGCDHNLALKENGTIWAWGANTFGQLGNGTSGDGTESDIPVKVVNIGTGVKQIAAGGDFSLALMNNGTVKSWGRNEDGQLGNGTDTPRNKPGPVSNLSNVKAIASDSSARHALALLDNGTVKSWGLNFDGQLGNGASLPGKYRTTPVRVFNLTGVKAIATGGYHSLALMESGKVKSWGFNAYGQLGNDTHGAGTDRSTPGNVTGLDNVRSISGGVYHSLAVLESGRARSWGSNLHGELGNGTSGAGADSDVPVGVKSLSGVKNIDGGSWFTLATQ
jgi:alpha-tubulin suppressor-like RCC1 family protein